MDTDRIRTSAEAAALRGRGWLFLIGQLLGIALFALGAVNILFAGAGPTAYRGVLGLGATVISPGGDGALALHYGDLVVLGGGLVVARLFW